jgi:hypothetical protein
LDLGVGRIALGRELPQPFGLRSQESGAGRDRGGDTRETTETIEESVAGPAVTRIVAVPRVLALTSPVEETVATAVFELCQESVGFEMGWPEESRTSACIWTVNATSSWGAGGQRFTLSGMPPGLGPGSLSEPPHCSSSPARIGSQRLIQPLPEIGGNNGLER